jgi:hypothetical protein
MRKMILILALVAVVGPVAALADSTAPTPAGTSNASCKAKLQSMGAATFRQTYGTFGRCVSQGTSQGRQDVTNAAKTCKAQQADPNFPGAHGGKSFEQFYGSNSSKGKGADRNAYGKCVSQQVQQSVQTEATTAASAAKTCKASLKADATAFATKYGKGRNAFGKCVSQTAKTK